MRLTLSAFGLELDVTLGRATEPETFETYQDAGTTGGTVVGFTRSAAPEWEVPGSYHQFEPEDGEDRRR